MAVVKLFNTQTAQWEPVAIGPRGNTGAGVANGGVTDQVLVKSSNSDFDTEWLTITTDFVGEGNTNLYYLDSRVDSHLSGANGITYSSGVITAEQDLSPGANVTFTKLDGLDTPTANTDAANKQYVDDAADTAYSNAISYADSVANTAYANALSYTDTELANLVNTAPVLLDTLNELAAAINDDPDFANSVTNQIATAYSNAVAYVDAQTTDTIEEGNTNLYFTDARVVTAIETNTVNSISVGATVQQTNTATTSSTNAETLSTWSALTYSSSKAIITATANSERQISELLITHNGANAVATEYGVVTTANVLFTVDCSLVSNDVVLEVTASSSEPTDFTIHEILFSV